MRDFFTEVRYALRFLRQRPLFSFVAICSLAIGIGASTAIFSVANALLLRPQPGIGDPDRVIEIGRTTGGQGFDTFSYPELIAMRESVAPLDEIAGWTWHPLSLTTASGGVRVLAMVASHNYFHVLGVRPFLGRFITADEDATPGAGPVAVVSHRFWRDRLDGDAGAIGRGIELNRRTFTVIGVLPEEFRGHVVGSHPDVYLPLTMMATASPGFDEFGERYASWFMAIGRLVPGATVEQADAAVRATLSNLPQRNDDVRNTRSARAIPLGSVPGFGRTIVTAFLGLLFAVVGMVLLIACSNVAGMLIARATAREREIAIRLAIGAGRRRLVGQLLLESLVLFAIGGAAGIAIAAWGTDLLSTMRLPAPVELDFDFRPDLRVLLFGLGIAMVTGIAFGLAPALQSTRPDLTMSLKRDAGRAGSRGGRTRRIFVASQIALSVILLACAGLFLRSLQRAAGIETGFDPRGAWISTFDLSMDGYDADAGRQFAGEMLERVRALPGVEAAALSSDLPLDLSDHGTGAYPEDAIDASRTGTSFNHVSDGYFEALGIELVRGRAFQPTDRPGSLPVVVVSRTFAESFWPGEDAIGRRIHVNERNGPLLTVVGIVADVKNQMLAETIGPMMYLPVSQMYIPSLTLTVKGASAAVAAAASRAVLEMDPKLSMTMPQSLADYTAIGVMPQRIAAIITTSLGVLALLLSAIGVYGVIAFMVAQRTREIGVRMALGARRADVLGMIVRNGLRIALPGFALGLAAALALSRLLRSFILGVAPVDPATFVVMPAMLLVTVLLASLAPARRASTIEPASALRNE